MLFFCSMPQIYFEKLKSFCNAEIFFWHIKENCNELSNLIADNGMLLAEAEKMFKSEGRQCEWLAVRALLQNTPYKGFGIEYHDNGKPYFANSSKHISISHTQEYVALAVSESPIGIDIESTNRNALSVAKAFLQPHEVESLAGCGNTAHEALCLWSAKEAAFKLASERVSVLKEIGITKNANDYTVVYPDGTTAVCYVCVLEGIVISCCKYY